MKERTEQALRVSGALAWIVGGVALLPLLPAWIAFAGIATLIATPFVLIAQCFKSR